MITGQNTKLSIYRAASDTASQSSAPDQNIGDEEIIGVITMQDVLEQLLQVWCCYEQ